MWRFFDAFLLRNLLFLLATIALGCATAQYTRRPTTAAPSPSPAVTVENAQEQSDAINRPPSKPYTGDLSIFEDPKRFVREIRRSEDNAWAKDNRED